MNKAGEIVNFLTIDVEDLLHGTSFADVGGRESENRILRNTNKLLGILSKKNVKATFFVLGCVAEKFPQLIRDMVKLGHEIGTHSYRHRALFEQGKISFAEDLRRSIDILENITNEKVLGFRAPEFSITKRSLWAIDVLIENRLKYDSSIVPVLHDRYGIPKSPRFPYIVKGTTGRNSEALIEFPPTTFSFLGINILIGGGGFFRMFPYSLIKRGLERINSKGKRAILYFHPWDLDPERPGPGEISSVGRFRRYCNLKKTEEKLINLLNDFRFGRIGPNLFFDDYKSWQP